MKILNQIVGGFFVLIILVNFGCGSEPRGRVPEDVVSGKTDNVNDSPLMTEITLVNFYLENSGSIYGYLNGNTNFKRVISSVLRDLELNASDINTNYINTDVHPFHGDITGFLRSLNPGDIQIGNTATSDLNLIFRTVLTATNKGALGIIISDGIYSIQGDPETILASLTMEKDRTRNEFIRRLRDENLETVIIKLSSEFNGRYYPANNSPVSINQDRPYYIWFIGEKEIIKRTKELIVFSELDGYENEAHYFINPENDIPYSVIPFMGRIGRFILREEGFKHNLSDAKPEERGVRSGTFGFSIAADLSGLPLDDIYLTNTENYRITSGWEIDSVTLVESENLTETNKKYLKNLKLNPTHFIFISSANNCTGQVKVSLSNREFPWVIETGTEDDSRPDENSTFGFTSLTGGISNAYQEMNDNEYYFDLMVTINN